MIQRILMTIPAPYEPTPERPPTSPRPQPPPEPGPGLPEPPRTEPEPPKQQPVISLRRLRAAA